MISLGASRRQLLALLVWLFAAMLSIATFLFVATGEAPGFEVWGFRGAEATFGMMFVTVSLFVLRQRPAHRLAWLFLLTGLLSIVQALATEYAIRALLAAPGSLPGGVIVGWIVYWIWFPAATTLAFILFLFPDGNLPSPRWRCVVWTGLFLVLIGTLQLAFAPGPLRGTFPTITNPFGLEWLRLFSGGALRVAMVSGLFVYTTATLSLFVRFRRSRGIERQQLKWFVLAVALIFITALGSVTGVELLELLFIFAVMLFPLTMGLAIVRYRLWDIDRIISRTLLYVSLSAALALVYYGSVVLLQGVLRPFVGTGSSLALVLSTLAIAALFHPLRRRLQGWIDRRFYRRRYDAAQSLARFAATARDEVDLQELSDDLVSVVGETVQPTKVGLWLAPQKKKEGE